jgi:three-Cys-motif partner protein
MPADDFHQRPFDEGTLTKLQIFELYAREWLPVFLARDQPPRKELHLFDFFAGPGTDSLGEPGSPLRLLRQLRSAQHLPGWPRVSAHAHFFDRDPEKIARLKAKVTEQPNQVPGLALEIEALEFDEALKRNVAILENPQGAKLLLIDQTGVDNVTPQVFRTLVEAPTCDFLFFLSSSMLHRFRDQPSHQAEDQSA